MSSLAAIRFPDKAPDVAGFLSEKDLETMVSRFDEQRQELKEFLQDKNLHEVSQDKSGSVSRHARRNRPDNAGATVHNGTGTTSHLRHERPIIAVTPLEANTILERAGKVQQDSENVQRLEMLTRKKRRLATFVALFFILALVSLVQLFLANDLSLGPVVREMAPEQSVNQVTSPPETVAQIPAAPAPVVQESAAPSETPPVASETTPEPASTAPSPLSATQPESAAPATKYVGSITSNKYHQPHCKWAKTIKPEKVRVFTSVADAHQAGYHQCPVCKPPVSDAPAAPASGLLANATN